MFGRMLCFISISCAPSLLNFEVWSSCCWLSHRLAHVTLRRETQRSYFICSFTGAANDEHAPEIRFSFQKQQQPVEAQQSLCQENLLFLILILAGWNCQKRCLKSSYLPLLVIILMLYWCMYNYRLTGKCATPRLLSGSVWLWRSKTKPTCAYLLPRLQRDWLCGAVKQWLTFRLIIKNRKGGGTCALFRIHQTLITKVHVKINQNIIKRLILGVYQWHRSIHQGDYSVQIISCKLLFKKGI